MAKAEKDSSFDGICSGAIRGQFCFIYFSTMHKYSTITFCPFQRARKTHKILLGLKIGPNNKAEPVG